MSDLLNNSEIVATLQTLAKTLKTPEYLVMFRAVDNYPSLKAFSGDAGYRGTAVDYAKEKLNMTLRTNRTKFMSLLPL